MRELAALGVQPQLEAAGIENLESVFFNRFGQFIYREPRGRHAGYALPEIGIHRGKLHRILYRGGAASGSAPDASTSTIAASASSRTTAASRCVRDAPAAARTGARATS